MTVMAGMKYQCLSGSLLHYSMLGRELQWVAFTHVECHCGIMVLPRENSTGRPMPTGIRTTIDERRKYLLSRNQPYRKNDNRLVEQKNSALVRADLGYDRLRRLNPGPQSA